MRHQREQGGPTKALAEILNDLKIDLEPQKVSR